MNFNIITLGCKVNQYESQAMREDMLKNGFLLSDDRDRADITIVNSCTVTSVSDAKNRKILNRVRRENPDGIVILTGCMPQAFPEESENFSNCDIVLGNAKRAELVPSIYKFLEEKQKFVHITEHIGKGEKYENISFKGRVKLFFGILTVKFKASAKGLDGVKITLFGKKLGGKKKKKAVDKDKETAQKKTEPNDSQNEKPEAEPEKKSENEPAKAEEKTETAETTENTTFVADEPTESEEMSFAETEPANENGVIAPQPKKKSIIQLPIIIGIVIVAVAAATLFVIKGFFDTSIVGTWIESVDVTGNSASSDEASKVDVYYTFNGDNTLDYRIGSMVWNGTYTVSTDDSGNQTLAMTLNGNETSCNYAVSGNMFSGRTLELSTSTAANKVKLKSGSEVKPELKVDKDFKADKKITGSWTYDNGYAKMTYKFNDDGTVEINQSDALNVDGTYLIKNGTIIIKYYYTDEVEMDVAYSVESNGLKLNDILYTKNDGSAKATTAAVTEAATETAATSAK